MNPLRVNGHLVAVPNLPKMGWSQEGHPAVKHCSNFFAIMAKLKRGHYTVRSVTWATPTAYDKKEVGETAGESAPNDGPKPDRQRQRFILRRFASWNVGSLTGKGKELVDEMKRRIDIMGIQETNWGGNSTRMLGDGYKVIYSREVNKRNGVEVTVAEKWTKGVVSMDKVSDRLMAVKLVMVKSW